MRLELQHPLVQPADVVHQLHDLVLDEMRLLAHAWSRSTDWITWIDSISSEGETMTSDAVRALNDVLEALVDVREDRFRRHEHEGRVLRLAGDEIALGDVLDMLVHVAAELRLGAHAPAVGAARIAFQASSGNFASTTSSAAPLGNGSTQSGRVPLESVAWKA